MAATNLDDAIRRNREAVARIVTVIEQLAPAEWEQPVAPGKWSPGQIAEHLVLTYDVSRQVLHGTSSIGGLPVFVRPLVRWVVLRAVRTGKFPRGGKARKGFVPSGRALERASVVQRLTSAVEAFAADYSAAAREGRTTFVHPAFGKIRLVDYALFNDLHTRHHTAQIPAAARL